MRSKLICAAVLALVAALAVAVPAGAAPVRFKVVSGKLKQASHWTADSGIDNGCYTGAFTDGGWTEVDYVARRHSIVTVRHGSLHGLQFQGKIDQNGQWKNQWTPDPAWEPICGPSTGPAYDAPTNYDCGEAELRYKDTALTLAATGHPALSGVFYKDDPYDDCGSDVPAYAVAPVPAPAPVSSGAWHKHKVALHGHGLDDSTDQIVYRGYNDQDGSVHATIDWSLTLVRVK